VWGVLEIDFDVSGAVSEVKDGENHSKKTTKQPEGISSTILPKPNAEMSRQTGDMECYKIYLNSIGWNVVVVFISVAIVHSGMQKMPRS
jgi:hypothetical protein